MNRSILSIQPERFFRSKSCSVRYRVPLPCCITLVTLLITYASLPQTSFSKTEISLDDPVFSQPIFENEIPVAFLEIKKRLEKLTVFRANFEQVKTIKLLQRPLRSSGHMIFSKEDGLYWHVSKPFASTLIVTEETIMITGDDGSHEEIHVKRNPVMRGLSRIFLSVFAGDVDTLKNHFNVYFSGDAEGWTMGLVPSSRKMKRMIHHIILRGSRTISRLDIKDQNKDETRMVFTDVINEPALLTIEEQKLFELM